MCILSYTKVKKNVDINRYTKYIIKRSGKIKDVYKKKYTKNAAGDVSAVFLCLLQRPCWLMSAWIGDYMDDIPDADNMADMDNMANIDNMDAMNKKNEKVLQNIKMTEKI